MSTRDRVLVCAVCAALIVGLTSEKGYALTPTQSAVLAAKAKADNYARTKAQAAAAKFKAQAAAAQANNVARMKTMVWTKLGTVAEAKRRAVAAERAALAVQMVKDSAEALSRGKPFRSAPAQASAPTDSGSGSISRAVHAATTAKHVGHHDHERARRGPGVSARMSSGGGHSSNR